MPRTQGSFVKPQGSSGDSILKPRSSTTLWTEVPRISETLSTAITAPLKVAQARYATAPWASLPSVYKHARTRGTTCPSSAKRFSLDLSIAGVIDSASGLSIGAETKSARRGSLYPVFCPAPKLSRSCTRRRSSRCSTTTELRVESVADRGQKFRRIPLPTFVNELLGIHDGAVLLMRISG